MYCKTMDEKRNVANICPKVGITMDTPNKKMTNGKNKCGGMQDLHRKDLFEEILNLSEQHLNDVVTYRKDCNREMVLTFRELNLHGRANYANFIKNVGRNIYPLIIASDHDNEQGSGVGTTFTLYLEDGHELKITPALSTYYEIYKCVSHTFLGLSVILTPFLNNPTAKGWQKPMLNYREIIQKAHASLVASTADQKGFKKELVNQLMTSILEFMGSVLEKESFTFEEWKSFNANNFPGIKKCMILATQTQANENVEALLKWKKMMGPKIWREVFVLIPTVWPVGAGNPRLELFRNLLDKDKVNTNIIMSEFPRNVEECRTLVGRVVGDRGIGRFVFGNTTCEQQMKTVGLSTGIDFVTDDAIPALHEALENKGIEPRPYLTATEKSD